VHRLRLAFAFVLLAAPSLRAQSGAEDLLDRSVVAHTALRSLKVTFEQVIQNPLTGSSSPSRGEMFQKGPRYLAIRFSLPKGDLIVADGQVLWVYLPSTNPGQVFRIPIGAQGSAVAGSVDVLSAFFQQPRGHYEVKDAGISPIDGRDAHAIILTPRKAGDAPFAKAVVWIDPKTAYVRQFETTDGSGLVRTVKVTKFGANARINDNVFKFVPPVTVKIFDQPGAP
jgi:outer membrane lipoprotein-sorting protein